MNVLTKIVCVTTFQPNFFLLVDLMVGFFSVLLDIIDKQIEEWQGGVVMCKVTRFIQGIAIYGSNYALVALSIDRLDSIARPLKSMSKGKTFILH